MQNGDIILNEIWTNTLRKVSESNKVDKDAFEMYFNGSKLSSLDPNQALVVANDFINYSVMNSYVSLMEECLQEAAGYHAPIKIVLAKDLPNVIPPTASSSTFFNKNTLNGDRTFANFIVGRSNAQAQVAASTCAQNPGLVYNPLFIYGESGIGKTHLLEAIGNQIKNNFPNMKIGFIPADAFVDDVYIASKNKQYDELKQSYKDLDLLLIDDIQFIADKPKSHEIFFNIFNHLVNNKKQICITSDKSPDDIKGLEARLITRFNQGLTVNIVAPEYETAVNIIKAKLDENFSISQQIDDDVISFIATNFSQSVRKIEGQIKRLIFYATAFSNDREHITLDLAQEAFKDEILSNKDTLSFNKIIKAVSSYYNISKENLCSKSRTQNVANARHIAIYLCRKLLDASYETIGNEFGKRDHSTIINSCLKVEELIKADPIYLKAVNDIEKQLTK